MKATVYLYQLIFFQSTKKKMDVEKKDDYSPA